MKIAVTYDNGEIFRHFGHTEYFKVYNVSDGVVNSEEVISSNGEGHGALAGLLADLGVNVLICGGIGGGAQMALSAEDIKIYGGVSGNADEAIKAFLADTLEYNPNVKCNHHSHEHADGHDCHSHSHTCGGTCSHHHDD